MTINDIGERIYKPANTFTTIPKGVYVTDTFNCPTFPFEEVMIDKSYLIETKKIRQGYELDYGARKDNFLPFHYIVELIDNRYEIIVGRPLNYRTFIYGKEEYISIAIIGDSNTDIYGKDLYKQLASLILPLKHIPGWRLDKVIYNDKMGPGFQKEQLNKFI